MPSRIQIEAVDALALKYALQRMADQSMGYGITDVDLTQHWLNFSVDRYAMNGTGFHVGTETFTAIMLVFHGPNLGVLNCMTPHAKDVVFPAAMDVLMITPAEEPHTYTIDDAINFLDKDTKEALGDATDEELMEEAHDRGMSEGDYYPPDDDFAWQELDHHLREALADLPSGHFEPSTGVWSIQFRDGEIAHQYEPVRLPGVKYVTQKDD